MEAAVGLNDFVLTRNSNNELHPDIRYSSNSKYLDELCHNLDEGNISHTADLSMQIIEENPEEDCITPLNRTNKHLYTDVENLANSGIHHESMMSHNEGLNASYLSNRNQYKLPSSLADIQAKFDQHSIHDKAKLLYLARLYKVQVEKNSVILSNVTDLQDQLITYNENVTKLEERIKELESEILSLKAIQSSAVTKCALCNKNQKRFSKAAIPLMQQSEGGDSTDTGDGLSKISAENAGEIDEEEEEDEEDLSDELEPDEEAEGAEEVHDGERTGKSTKKSPKKKTFHRAGTQTLQDLGKKKVRDQKGFAAMAIIEKIKNKKWTKFKNFMPLKAVCKQIHNFYSERTTQVKENSAVKDEPFASFVYVWYTNTFSFKKLAEQKFIIFVLSLKKYLHYVRINLFARFMNLLDGSANFTLDEFNKYIEGLDFMNTSNLGFIHTNVDTDAKHYTPFLRGVEYVRLFSDNKMPMEEYIEFRKEFESLKENDPKNFNKNGIIDVDRLLSKILGKYRIICNRTKQFVVNAFKAADLDGNKYCSLKEFVQIYRNIESEKYDYNFVENIFNDHADVTIGTDVNLSFDKFTVVCVEYGLFSDAQQDQFLGINSREELIERFQVMKLTWPTLQLEIDDRISRMKKSSNEEKAQWIEILALLEDKVKNLDTTEPTDIKPILIAYKILDNETKILVDKEIEVDGYGVRKSIMIPVVSRRESVLE